MKIDRRSFSRRSLAAAGALWSAPALLERLFSTSQDPQPTAGAAPAPGSPRGRLAAAIAQALADDKPLLVFVVPAEPVAHFARGQRLGALCNHGTEFRRELALTAPICASVADLRALLPDIAFSGAPLMFVVEPGDKAPARAIDAEHLDLPRFRSVEERLIRADIDALTAAMVTALRPDPQALERLAQRMRAHADATMVQTIGTWLAGGELPTDAQLVRAAAWVRSAATALPEARRAEVLAALDAAISSVLLQPRLPGSRWHIASPCGSQPEDPQPGEPVLGGPCGTGSVPPLSERFLKFLTEN